MTRVQQAAAGTLFLAVLILGGWAWSQDDSVNSPSDRDPATDPAPVTKAAPETEAAEAAPGDTTAPPTTAPPTTAPPTTAPPTTAPTTTADTSVPDASPPAATASRGQAMILGLWIFVLAVFLGIELISKVPPTLHTPLMSGSNAISGITLVGAVIVASAVVGGISPIAGTFARFLGFIAVTLAMINAVGGFLVTHRMLSMFARK